MRKRPFKHCALCLEEKLLCDSHLIPAGIMRLIRAQHLRNPNPIVVSDTIHYTTSKPCMDYLLCEGCEKRFSTKGEEWVSKNCYRGKKAFRIQEALSRNTPVTTLPDGVILYRGASIPEIDSEQLTYFALSVIWRAAVHKWRNGPRTVSLELGPYLEPLRQFLRGESPFPDCMMVVVRVSSLSGYAPSVNLPVSRPGSGFRVHAFAILGLTFLLVVGKMVDVIGQPNTWPSPDHFIGVVPEIDIEDQQRALMRYSKAIARGFVPK